MKTRPALFCALAAALAAACFSACEKNESGEALPDASASFFAMGTVISISARAPSASEAEQAVTLAQAEILRLEKIWSATDPESEIFAVNASAPEAVTVSDETAELLRFSKQMAEETAGAFDPTVYPLVDAWGFLTHQYRIPSDGEIADILLRTGIDKMRLEGNAVAMLEGAGVDLGGVAKGAAGDAAAAVLRESGIASAIINLGGNVHLVGARPSGEPWRVGVRDPFSTSEILGVVTVESRAIVTSGAYERNFTGEDGRFYHHIMDGATGRPAESGLVSVTIIAEEGRLADALSTALFVMGAEKAASFWREHGEEQPGAFEAVLVTDKNTVLVTEGAAKIFELVASEYAEGASIITKDPAYSPPFEGLRP